MLNWSAPRELNRSVFLMAPKLAWVHSRNAGLDSFLFPELVESPVTLTNGSGVFSAPLGEFALAAMLYFAKDFRRMIRNQVAGKWEPFDVLRLAGQTVGIVGYGDIGKEVAWRAKAMGMRVLRVEATSAAAGKRPGPVEKMYPNSELREMIAVCDYVVVAAPLTAETHHMIGEAEFAAMKPDAVIINVGRGPVIDEAAMARALAEGRIKGAGLDVFEHEPLPAESPLYKMENVLSLAALRRQHAGLARQRDEVLHRAVRALPKRRTATESSWTRNSAIKKRLFARQVASIAADP